MCALSSSNLQGIGGSNKPTPVVVVCPVVGLCKAPGPCTNQQPDKPPITYMDMKDNITANSLV